MRTLKYADDPTATPFDDLIYPADPTLTESCKAPGQVTLKQVAVGILWAVAALVGIITVLDPFWPVQIVLHLFGWF
jgi:hypothetical protein